LAYTVPGSDTGRKWRRTETSKKWEIIDVFMALKIQVKALVF
jgi:hypothetical protein